MWQLHRLVELQVWPYINAVAGQAPFAVTWLILSMHASLVKQLAVSILAHAWAGRCAKASYLQLGLQFMHCLCMHGTALLLLQAAAPLRLGLKNEQSNTNCCCIAGKSSWQSPQPHHTAV